jgi:hypothetical protein
MVPSPGSPQSLGIDAGASVEDPTTSLQAGLTPLPSVATSTAPWSTPARSAESPQTSLTQAGAMAETAAEALIPIDDVQKALNRSRASVYRYTNTDPRNLNPPFNPRKLNPEYRSDQKDPLLFHPNEVARFARDVLRIKEVTVEVLNSPSTATQQLLGAILDELRSIRRCLGHAEGPSGAAPQENNPHRSEARDNCFDHQSRPAA